METTRRGFNCDPFTHFDYTDPSDEVQDEKNEKLLQDLEPFPSFNPHLFEKAHGMAKSRPKMNAPRKFFPLQLPIPGIFLHKALDHIGLHQLDVNKCTQPIIFNSHEATVNLDMAIIYIRNRYKLDAFHPAFMNPQHGPSPLVMELQQYIKTTHDQTPENVRNVFPQQLAAEVSVFLRLTLIEYLVTHFPNSLTPFITSPLYYKLKPGTIQNLLNVIRGPRLEYSRHPAQYATKLAWHKSCFVVIGDLIDDLPRLNLGSQTLLENIWEIWINVIKAWVFLLHYVYVKRMEMQYTR